MTRIVDYFEYKECNGDVFLSSTGNTFLEADLIQALKIVSISLNLKFLEAEIWNLD